MPCKKNLPFYRSRFQQLRERSAEELKATRAAIAILKSNATECCFSILDHVLPLSIDPVAQSHRHQLAHGH